MLLPTDSTDFVISENLEPSLKTPYVSFQWYFCVFHPGSKNTSKLLYLGAFWEGACAASEMSVGVLDMGQAEPFSGGDRGEDGDASLPRWGGTCSCS